MRGIYVWEFQGFVKAGVSGVCKGSVKSCGYIYNTSTFLHIRMHVWGVYMCEDSEGLYRQTQNICVFLYAFIFVLVYV